MCVLAHPDDETLGMGGTLAHYAREGIETYLVTATRGERGRFYDHAEKPDPQVIGKTREAELRKAASVLGIREVAFLDYLDAELDQVDPTEAQTRIADHFRRVRPDVVATFGPDGGYGHPDHVAISQFTVGATVVAADSLCRTPSGLPAHRVSKLYYMAWGRKKWDAYQAAFRTLVSQVDGISRQASAWPDWEITSVVETSDVWETVWRAVQCHQTQLTSYGPLGNLSPEDREALWGREEYYRVFSTVNGGRLKEADLFEGLRPAEGK